MYICTEYGMCRDWTIGRWVDDQGEKNKKEKRDNLKTINLLRSKLTGTRHVWTEHAWSCFHFCGTYFWVFLLACYPNLYGVPQVFYVCIRTRYSKLRIKGPSVSSEIFSTQSFQPNWFSFSYYCFMGQWLVALHVAFNSKNLSALSYGEGSCWVTNFLHMCTPYSVQRL